MRADDRDRIVALLQTDRFDRALTEAEAVLARQPDDPEAQLYRGIALRAAGRRPQAAAAFDAVGRQAVVAGRIELAQAAGYQLGILQMEAGNFAAAATAFGKAAELAPPGADLCAGLCQALCRLGRFDEARPWGERTLRQRDRDVGCDPSEVVAKARPKPFDPTAKGRNIVSYSLFGADRFYHECAVTIARTTPASYPEFTARFYCAPDLPRPVLKALAAAEAQVMLVKQGAEAGLSPLTGTFWRFLAFDDPGVDVVLVRDVDSPVLARERAAVDLWLADGAPFLCLRDHPVHAEPILAGMWGGFTGLLPRLQPLFARYAQSDHSKFADQRFLRQVVWPRIRDAALSLDSSYAIGRSVDFPPGFPKFGSLHVGMSWTRTQILGKG